MENFYKTHAFLLEHFNAPVRRSLMDNIDWSYRLICIRGPRGVGRTSFLLQYAKENFDPHSRQCLYINANSFYFQSLGIVDFAGRFIAAGGRVLLIDQVFKLPEWRRQLCECYRQYPYLRIVYSTTSVEPVEEDEYVAELLTISRTYVLHGFSFREYIGLMTGHEFRTYSLAELIDDHEYIMRSIGTKIRPWQYFDQYLHYGYYPFFLKNRNFTEALLKAMNNMIEVDVLFNKQVELKYLARIKKLLFLLAISDPAAPNISKMAEDIGTSRATVMNYLKYLEEARLINMIHRAGDTFPKKPAAIYLHDTNLIYAGYVPAIEQQTVMETFFVNVLWRHHKINKGRRDGFFRINDSTDICVCDNLRHVRNAADAIIARYNTETCHGNEIPLWLFGFLY